jgi:hypothetical protein
MNRHALVLAFVIVVPITLHAQNGGGSARAELSRAIAAYQNLDFDSAAITLRRALNRELTTAERIEALSYLGAAEHYRGRPDSAKAVFRRLILLAPGFQLDTLVFPPEVTRTFEDVRSSTDAETPAQLAVSDTLSQPPPPPPPPVASGPAPQPDTSVRLLPAHGAIVATAGGIVANMRAHSEGGGLSSASGTVLGLAAGARLGRFELGVKYFEGSLGSRDIVEGAVALRFVTTPWLALQTGPHVRRYETSLGSGDERWAMWQLGARAETRIVGSVRGHAMLWQGLGLSVNVPPGSGTARGGEIGATIETPRGGPFRFGIAYSFDHASVGESRRETVNALIVTAGLR